MARTRPLHRHLVSDNKPLRDRGTAIARARCNRSIVLTQVISSRGAEAFGIGETVCVRCCRRAHIPAAEFAPPAPTEEVTITNPFGPDPDDEDDTDVEDPWGDDDEPEFDPYAKGPAPAPKPEPPTEAESLYVLPPVDQDSGTLSVAEQDIGSVNLGALEAVSRPPEPPVFEPDPIMPWTPPDVASELAERLTVAEAIERAPLPVWYYDGSKETLLNGVELIPRAQGLWVLNMGDGQGFRARPADTILAVRDFPSAPESTTVVDSSSGDGGHSRHPSNQLVPDPPEPAPEPALPKEKAVTTTTVRRGANRASASARTKKAAQRTPLPKRGDDTHAEMQAAIEEAVAEVAKPARRRPSKATAVKALKGAMEAVVTEQGGDPSTVVETKAKRLPRAKKATPPEKIAAKVEKIERGDRDTAVNSEGRSKTSVKAHKFMSEIEALDAGWKATLSEFDGDCATVVAKRGDRERIEIAWDGGVFVPEAAKYIRDGNARLLRNASDALKNWAPKTTAALEPKRKAPAPKAKTSSPVKKAAK